MPSALQTLPTMSSSEKKTNDSENESNWFESDEDENEEDSHFEFNLDKPMEQWTGADFPKKRSVKPRGINIVLDGYSRARKTLCKKRTDFGEDVEPVCCDGVAGICGLFFLLIADISYVAYATVCNKLAIEDDIRLVWLSVLVWVVVLFKLIRRFIRLGRLHGGCFSPFASVGDGLNSASSRLKATLRKPWDACWKRIDGDEKTMKKKKDLAKKIICIIIMLAFVIFTLIYFVILKSARNLVSLAGLVVLVSISVLISWHPGKIIWQPVCVGLFIQLLFAVLTLQTRPGFIAFQFLGDRMSEFLANSLAGSQFVFGSLDCFAFTVLPVVIFFSSFISVLFHLGIITILIDKPAIVATKLLRTTGPETLNAVANIFVSMTESPLITRPYMHMMTNSELHSIIVNGFASVAGSVLAAYISFGVPANHLLIACVMSAPAALAISKVIYPETCRAPLANTECAAKIKSPYNNLLEAAMVGAMEAVPICGGIASNLIAFLSIYNFFNNVLTWLGARACLSVDLTFELIFSYALWPIAFVIGIPQEDCFKVAELIGVKSLLNEFVAFERLGYMIKDSVYFNDRDTSVPIQYLRNGSWIITMKNLTTLRLQYGALYTRRAEVISTYALCGFANVGSIGIMLGAMVTLLPHRRKELSEMVLGGMVGGTIACFLTGCFAGLFYEENL